MIKYVFIAIFSGILSSFAQILLKKSAQKERVSIIKQYLNFYVISGYVITLICMMLTIIAFKGIPYKLGPILESLSYLYIMVLSKLFFGEKITYHKLVGNILIFIGVIVFSVDI